MKKILIHTHIYYKDKWYELKEILKNFSKYEIELHITMPELNLDLKEDILAFRPDAQICIVENKGYDIAPFLHVINKLDLQNYSYLVKLHTKKDQDLSTHVNKINLQGSLWRDCLLEPFKTKESINTIIQKLENNDKLAMHANFKLIVFKEGSKRVKKKVAEFLDKYSLPQRKFAYVGGTMFIAKADCFSLLQSFDLKVDDFTSPEIGEPDLAHVIERILGYCVYAKNKEIKDVITPSYIQKTSILFARIARFVYQNHITDKKHIIKICTIPIYIKRFK